jgi:hypothetical protein
VITTPVKPPSVSPREWREGKRLVDDIDNKRTDEGLNVATGGRYLSRGLFDRGCYCLGRGYA